MDRRDKREAAILKENEELKEKVHQLKTDLNATMIQFLGKYFNFYENFHFFQY